ncbi:MAG: hypothetical protein HDT28_04865 [Clostridiales bacterium]|nr:hypothetical protein [Clostridiales bacterium]
MKTSNLIIAALSAVLLAACDKPNPTTEPTKEPIYHNLTVKTFSSVEESFGIGRIVADVLLYKPNAPISFDTIESSKSRIDFSLVNTTPMQFLEASASDTTSHLQALQGNHQLLILFQIGFPWDEKEYIIKQIKNINIISDTVICDTLSRADLDKYINI